MEPEQDLGQRLTDLVPYLDVPDIDLTERVLADVRAASSPVLPSSRRLTVLAWAAAIAVALGVIATLAVEPARHAVADWLDWGNTRIEPRSDIEFPNSSDSNSDFGVLVDPASASTDPELHPDPLPLLGRPDEMRRDGATITYVWWSDHLLAPIGDSRIGAAYSVGPVLDSVLTSKFVDTDSTYFPVTVGGVNGLWLADPHLREPDGDRPSIAGPTLLWMIGETQFRFESSLPLDRVHEIVGSFG